MERIDTGPPYPRQPRVAFLLGKPVRGASVLLEVFDCLRKLPVGVAVHVLQGDNSMPPWVFDVELVVQRGLGVPELTSARHVEDAGVLCCNRIAATLAVRDRALTFRTLADARIPIPATVRAATWPEVRDLAGGQPVVVKMADERIGRGLGVLIAGTGDLPPEPPFPGPYVTQEYVRNDGRDHKVYVAGRHAAGLVKTWPRAQPSSMLGLPVAIDSELADLSRLVGTALGLEIYGVDFLFGPRGPVVVDVNPFPGFRGVPRAAQLIVDHLTTIVTRQASA